jgi:asparagine synthase (glutamine-hydrolysing)
MRRLAIIDLETGDQPTRNEDGSVVAVCNGELYDYRERRAELTAAGHRFRGMGDVEVLPHLYEEHGPAAFERVRGMFAAALWDERRRRLVLARDRFGIKPLYLADTPHGLAFASELPPLLALGADATVDRQALSDYLVLGYVPGDRTLVRGVRRLPAGSALVWEDGRVAERSFAPLAPPEGPVDLEATLRESVRLHLRADVPLAVLLSGGLDSSLVASLAAEELGAPPRTFTVGFGDAAFDEVDAARAVARAIGSEHFEIAVRPDAAADLPAILGGLDEPLADPSAIPLWYVCRAVAEHVKVVLAGDGGDELFGGYSRYAWDPVAARLGRVLPARALAGALERLPGVAGRSGRKDPLRRAVKLLRHAELPEAERYLSWFALTPEPLRRELAGDAAPAARAFAAELAGAPAGLTALGRRQWVDVRTLLRDDLLLKGDRVSMAHSLELRVPFVDPEVARAGLWLPDREKVRRVETKVALRRLVARRLPPAIAARPKQGFEVPISRWLREELGELAGDLVPRGTLVEARAAARLVDEHRSGRADHGLRLYALLALELWHDAQLRSRVAGRV